MNNLPCTCTTEAFLGRFARWLGRLFVAFAAMYIVTMATIAIYHITLNY